MLAMADRNGEIQASIPGLARLAGVPIPDCEEALAKFIAPDPYSRTPDDEGRRIEKIEGGWSLLNHAKYREMASRDDSKAANTERQCRHREKEKRNATVTPRNAKVTPSNIRVTHTLHIAEAEAEAGKDSLLRKLSARADGPSDLEAETGMSEEELAACTKEAEVASVESPAPAAMLLQSEDDAPNGKSFPWRQIASAMKRLTPTMKMPSAGDRRDHAMRKFWRDNGKSLGCFELLAQKVAESDYVQARNGHTTVNGRAYTWSWIFTKGPRGKLRAEEIMAGDFANDKMAWVIEKKAKAVMTKVMLALSNTPIEVNLSEMWNGEKRWKEYDRHANGYMNVMDQKN